ncbi:glycosyltransferase [Phaeocystidibacter luteus]|uniref:Glycosyltransferase family 2 protein n=1 Tax=Phaeocystidibacter luteus TaxID=911197 RepID=A0A6N6RMS3_9FLAO|nr:glycosyltransferase family 2 protein [Phaeocystidibacter luteus]KAB2814848.1 glycosyltransferase family 2 protein [Phaeocystidibacter luteus]
MLKIVLNVIFILFAVQTFYLFLYAFASMFYRKRRRHEETAHFSWAVLIPVYREDEVILHTVENAISDTSGLLDVHIYVLSDGLQDETNTKLEKLGARVIPIVLDKSTKAKSLRIAANRLEEANYDKVVILDADNRMTAENWNFLLHSVYAEKPVVQCNRSALNSDTPMAFLDTLNEAIGNSIFRKGHNVLGISAALTGSGMVFDFRVFHEMVNGIDEEMSGEDKFYELYLLENEHFITYAHEVVVLDEKVSNTQQFSKQRTRWISSQYAAFFSSSAMAFVQLGMGNIGYFDKWLQWGFLPKFILFGLLSVIAVIDLVLNGLGAWVQLYVFLVLAFMMAIPRAYYDARMIQAILFAPKAMVALIKGILGIKKDSARTFNVTEKGSNRKSD